MIQRPRALGNQLARLAELLPRFARGLLVFKTRGLLVFKNRR
jgi:hypothetical protein